MGDNNPTGHLDDVISPLTVSRSAPGGAANSANIFFATIFSRQLFFQVLFEFQKLTVPVLTNVS